MSTASSLALCSDTEQLNPASSSFTHQSQPAGPSNSHAKDALREPARPDIVAGFDRSEGSFQQPGMTRRQSNTFMFGPALGATRVSLQFGSMSASELVIAPAEAQVQAEADSLQTHTKDQQDSFPG